MVGVLGKAIAADRSIAIKTTVVGQKEFTSSDPGSLVNRSSVRRDSHLKSSGLFSGKLQINHTQRGWKQNQADFVSSKHSPNLKSVKPSETTKVSKVRQIRPRAFPRNWERLGGFMRTGVEDSIPFIFLLYCQVLL
jgi:hypothetical protein